MSDFLRTVKLFSKVTISFWAPLLLTLNENSSYSKSSLILGIVSLFNFSHFSGCIKISHWDFNLHFPITNDGASQVALVVKNPPTIAGDIREASSIAGSVRKIPWRKAGQPTPAPLPGESHRQKSSRGYSPWVRKASFTFQTDEGRGGRREMTGRGGDIIRYFFQALQRSCRPLAPSTGSSLLLPSLLIPTFSMSKFCFSLRWEKNTPSLPHLKLSSSILSP